jgi:hypothetical protein
VSYAGDPRRGLEFDRSPMLFGFLFPLKNKD